MPFALGMISGSLPACLAYMSYPEILIRPLIAPTRYHDAFAGAEHRVYISPTLGYGGELERAFGKRKIDRIPVSAGWETQGTGRRFFVFLDLLQGTSIASLQGWSSAPVTLLPPDTDSPVRVDHR